jgi:23S rRNA (adenine2503-C2)-methyltransferase
MRSPFLQLTLPQARECVAELGFAPERANQLRRWLLTGGAIPFSVKSGEVSSAQGEVNSAPIFLTSRKSRQLLDELEQRFNWDSIQSAKHFPADDGSCKYLLGLNDGEAVEAVWLPGTKAPSACLSTQVGCAMACKFCASGLDEVVRNLKHYELLEQVVQIRRHVDVRRLVFMGSGEPTQNLAELKQAMEVLRAEGGIGPRRILVSTVGPPKAVQRLGELGLKFTLALSLHAIDAGLRAELIPTQSKVDPLDLLAAADQYAADSGRAYQVEYVLIGGVNDSPQQATDFADALAGRRAHVSLIPWNAVPGMDFQSPTAEHAQQFAATLKQAGVSVRLRNTVGGSAQAACGQLRRASRTSV